MRDALSVVPIMREAARLALAGQKASLDLPNGSELWELDVDAAEIRQLFVDLFLDAAQTMPAGGTITVRAENVLVEAADPLALAPGRYVRVEVAGRGIGRAERYVPARARAAAARPSLAHAPASGAAATAAAPTRLDGTRILVMDDEESVRAVAAACLRHAGAVVETVADGARAVDAYARALEASAPFAVVLLDLTVRGGMGGVEAARLLCERDPRARCIVMSGYADDPVLANFGAHGFAGVVPKPFSYQQLVRVVGEVLARGPGAGPAGQSM
jgi:CheY-like chemotaxis protein